MQYSKKVKNKDMKKVSDSRKNGSGKKCNNLNNSKKNKSKNDNKNIGKKDGKMNSTKREKKISKMCDFYYMAVDDVRARDLFEIMKEPGEFSLKTELWDDAQVIEIQTDETHTIDIEKIDYFKDEQDRKFLTENHVEVIYSIRIDECDEKNMIMIFKEIVEKLGGFVCSDTEDFMPYIVK